ncbi:hypothetical protein AAFC00_003968 [Neodothiora populina]|uniref:Pseudouridine synthase I TruA alpha/beta domain-containing protein n=1 Tax=Neodothiora populina TaxID=2781224 RepID=A0ABR3PI43_9PEZI
MADTTETPVAASQQQPADSSKSEEASSNPTPAPANDDKANKDQSDSERKRKRFEDNGSKSGRGRKRRDMGRKEWEANQPDRRARNDAEKAKPRDDNSVLPAPFASEEIAAEDRKPKRKVAVLIGYSGTGYKGMQINTTEKTIEGDLFTAFVKAGAISKANADDPKKSQLVRCARTDKGVHAAGNMISLKLIIEDDNIVEKINEHLTPQIRVWGIERTIGSFSCYQSCDSRWYEYLLPSHCLLPPHPSSWLARQLEASADEVGDREGFDARQADVKDFWKEVDDKEIKPILETLDEDIRDLVIKALYEEETTYNSVEDKTTDDKTNGDAAAEATTANSTVSAPAEVIASSNSLNKEQKKRIEAAVKSLKLAYNDAKRRYRVPVSRIQRLQEALTAYVGTRNFHNYTILKTYRDPSSKRNIKSFLVNHEPKIINDTEWLSLKVHGQSFMMHQIRKMVGMASLVVRCGAPTSRIHESYEDIKMSIPKVPGLGLLLERPVFDSYNELQAVKHGREKLEFSKWEEKLEAFKQKEIYQRIFEEEKQENTFHLFFNQIDNYRERHFLYLTSKGVDATIYPKGEEPKAKAAQRAKDGASDGKTGGDEKNQLGVADESDDEAEGLTKKEIDESG